MECSRHALFFHLHERFSLLLFLLTNLYDIKVNLSPNREASAKERALGDGVVFRPKQVSYSLVILVMSRAWQHPRMGAGMIGDDTKLYTRKWG